MSGLEVDEKPSQWMARFRHAGGEWDRGDVERWALLRHLTPSLRTTLELPTPQLSMDELLQKADTLYVTLPSATVSTIAEIPTRTSSGRHRGRPPGHQCLVQETRRTWRQWREEEEETTTMLGDESMCCSGPPCPRYRPDLPKGRTTESGNAKGSR